MPPLRHWLLYGAVTGALGGGMYYQVYLPRSQVQYAFESQWESTRLHSQEVWLKLAAVERSSTECSQEAEKKPLPTSKRLHLFCEIQKARAALLRLTRSDNPMVSRSFTDRQSLDFLSRLDAVEDTHCVAALPCRSLRSISVTQFVRYAFCFTVYVWAFHILPFVVRSGLLERAMKNSAGKFIMDVLHIPCTTATEVESDVAGPRTFLLPARHWIETAAFWSSGLLQPGDTVHLGSVSYASWWKKEGLRVQSLAVPFGFPVASDASIGAANDQHSIAVVGVAGLHDVVFSGAPSSDGKEKRKGYDVYTDVMAHQYQRSHLDRKQSTEEDGVEKTTKGGLRDGSTEGNKQTLLFRVEQRYSHLLPVFGNMRERKLCPLHIYVGSPSSEPPSPEFQIMMGGLHAWESSLQSEYG